MSFPRYPKYRDSGVEWLGEVPEHWEVLRSDSVLSYRKENARTEDFRDSPVFYYSIPAFQEVGDGILERGDNIQSDKISLHGGELLVSKLNPRKGVVLISRRQDVPIVCSTEFVPMEATGCDLRFAYWLYMSDAVRGLISSAVQSVTRSHQRANPADITRIWLPFPTLPEQRAIADFLDRETVGFDSLVAEQERLTELLQEKRRAVISRAITKGLQPEVPTKPSNIDWLGNVPVEWNIKSLGQIADIVRGASPRPAGDLRYFHGDAIPWVTVGEITKNSSMFLDTTESALTRLGAEHSRLFPSGTVIYSNSGATLGVPKILRCDACANDGVIGFLRLNESVLPEFIYYFLSSITQEIREKVKQGSGQPNLNTDLVRAIRFACPSLAEQWCIVNHVEEVCQQTDALIVEVERSISVLRERRAAVISAAVTGKIDVRNYAADQSEAA